MFILYLLFLFLPQISSTLEEQKLQVQEDLPKCKFIKNSVELSPDGFSLAGRIASFVCICSPKSRRYQGSLSAIMDEPLSTIPLHMVMSGQVTYGDSSFGGFDPIPGPGLGSGPPKIQIEIKKCERIKLKIDFPALFMTRPGGTGTDVVLKISDSHRVHLSRMQVLPDREHNIILRNISGKVVISGKIDCLGCSNISKATDADSLPTLLKLDVSGVTDSLSLDGVTSLVPLKLTYRESNVLVVRRSRFSVVPWPGFYIYNVTSASIKENWFKDVAPRSLVARTGKQLEITDNILSVANVLDVSSFAHVTIKCNRDNEFEPIPSECPVPTDLDGLPYTIPSIRHSAELILFVGVVILFGHVWIVLIALCFIAVAGYKFSVGSNEYDDPTSQSANIRPPLQSYYSDYPTSMTNYSVVMPTFLEHQQQQQQQQQHQQQQQQRKKDKKFSSCIRSSSEEPSSVAKYQAGPVDSEDDEYSTSSRLHLAGCGNTGPGGPSDWVTVTPAGSPSNSLSASRAHPTYNPNNFQISPILHQLESLSLHNNQNYNDGQEFISRSEDGSDIYYPSGGGGNLPFSHIDSDVEIVPETSTSRSLTTPQEMYSDYTSPPQRRFMWQYTKV